MTKNDGCVGVGVIGCGSISKWSHLPAYGALAEAGLVQIVAVCDAVTERAEEMGRKYRTKAYSDYRDLLNDKQIDAVSVCISNHLHAPVTIAALLAGKHVLCEKPMATSQAEAQAMIDAAAQSGRKLMIAQSQRYAPAHRKGKEVLDSKVLGRVLSFDTSFCHGGPEGWCADHNNATWFFRKDLAHFGAMGDLGIHKADLLQYLLGERIVEAGAFIGTLAKRDEKDAPIQVDDNAVCILKTESGIMGQLTAGWTYPSGEANYTRIYCEKGILRLYDHPDYAMIVEKSDGETIYHQIGKIFNNEKPEPSRVNQDFIDCIRKDTPPPISGADGCQALKVILACFESARTRSIVRID